MSKLPFQVKEIIAAEELAGNWPEDAAHENGEYKNICLSCGRYFIGHKRRLSCKVCAPIPAPTA